jgi:hypothetical protein
MGRQSSWMPMNAASFWRPCGTISKRSSWFRWLATGTMPKMLIRGWTKRVPRSVMLLPTTTARRPAKGHEFSVKNAGLQCRIVRSRIEIRPPSVLTIRGAMPAGFAIYRDVMLLVPPCPHTESPLGFLMRSGSPGIAIPENRGNRFVITQQ